MKRIVLMVCWLGLAIAVTGTSRVFAGERVNARDSAVRQTSNSLPAYTPTKNYVVEKIFLDESGERCVSNVTYLDGFGRKLQVIQVNGSPGGTGDIIIPYVYGVHGRVEKEYLPYAKEGNNGAFDNNSLLPSNWSIHGSSDAPFAFTLSEYDNSPLDRIVKRTGPGKAWHDSGKGVETIYGMNGENEVRLYRVTWDGVLTLGGYYRGGSLQKVIVKDEDGNQNETFTDNDGRTVLSVNVNVDERLETYSVYDDYGRLRYVLSPEASALLGNTINENVLERLAYRYNYDRYGRLVEKRLPGCAPVYMVYDRKDRLVMSQDGKQRDENPAKWSYSLYDGQNRVVENGEIELAGTFTHAALQAEVSSSDDYVPAGNRSALQYTVYDNYEETSVVAPRPFRPDVGYSTSYHTALTGLVTSVKTRVLGVSPPVWLTSTTYYDDRCRVIQIVGDNLQGGTSCLDMKYDFAGNVIRQREHHSINTGQTDVVESENEYDDRGRLLSSTVKLNNGSPATESYTYDAVGRLVKKQHGNAEETLTYNARGWLTGKESAAFQMRLRYESPMGGSVARWNGNISEWEWQHGASPALMYGFTYDGVSRLTGTVQKQKIGTTWGIFAGSYLEKGLTYDLNGNIKTLQRTANGTTVDNLVYSYTGNQLTGLTENVSGAPSGDIYARGGVSSGTYVYDPNGNMINDSRRALNLSYNVLNLLSEVNTTSGVLKAKYDYFADGTKLRVRDTDGNGFDYLGSLTYRKSSAGLELEAANFGGGVIRVNVSNSGVQEVNYFLTDHLGSVRVIVDGNGVVQERNDYYPFGAKHVRGDYPQLSVNRFKYNGKEEQVTGDLGYLDYGARMGDLALGRWFVSDPLQENYLSKSPYHFSGNNPVLFVDKTGLDYWSTNDPNEIARFMNAFNWENQNLFESFDFGKWAYASDKDFLESLKSLWFNDETQVFYFSYSEIIDDEIYRIGRSLKVLKTDGYTAQVPTYKYNWYQRSSGAIQQDYTLEALLIPIGKGVGVLTSWFGKLFNSPLKSVGAAAARNLGKVLQTGGHTIKSSTAKALGLTKGQLKNALERLKKYNNMRHDSHQKIMGNGDVIDSHTGKFIDNLFDYVD